MIIDIKDFECRLVSEVTSPEFNRIGDKYEIKCATGRRYAFGYYVGSAAVGGYYGRAISATVGVTTDGAEVKAMPLLVFYDAEGKKLQSDYLTGAPDEYRATVAIPNGATTVSFELIAYCFGGSAAFIKPTLSLTECNKRSFIAATAYFERKGGIEENMKAMLSILDDAGAADEKPDIVCFTESAHDIGAADYFYMRDGSEDLKRVCDSAKKNSLYVIFTYHEEDEEGYRYNTAIVICPDGEIVGKYRKTQLTLGELKKGLTPGDSLPVIELPFAKIGIIICWDQWFYENLRTLIKNGAEMIFWPSRGYHEERMITRARDNGVYYLSCHPIPERCCIVHPTTGKILARGSGKSGYVSARIDLDERPISEYKSFGMSGGNDKEIFLNELRYGIYS